ncbi:MAG: hypothetical protein AAF515_13650 [Pseudomonadota bacterium]
MLAIVFRDGNSYCVLSDGRFFATRRVLVALLIALASTPAGAQTFTEAGAAWQQTPRYVDATRDHGAASELLYASCPEGYDSVRCVQALRSSEYAALLPDNPAYWRAFQALLGAELPTLTPADLYRIMSDIDRFTKSHPPQDFIATVREYGHWLLFAAPASDRARLAVDYARNLRRLLAGSRTLLEYMIFTATLSIGDRALLALQAQTISARRRTEALQLAQALTPLTSAQRAHSPLLEASLEWLQFARNDTGAFFCAVDGGPLVDVKDPEAVRSAFAWLAAADDDGLDDLRAATLHFRDVLTRTPGLPLLLAVTPPSTESVPVADARTTGSSSIDTYERYAQQSHRVAIHQTVMQALALREARGLFGGVPDAQPPTGFAWEARTAPRSLCLVAAAGEIADSPDGLCATSHVPDASAFR